MNIKKFLVGVTAGALMLGGMAIPALAKGPSAPAKYLSHLMHYS